MGCKGTNIADITLVENISCVKTLNFESIGQFQPLLKHFLKICMLNYFKGEKFLDYTQIYFYIQYIYLSKFGIIKSFGINLGAFF